MKNGKEGRDLPGVTVPRGRDRNIRTSLRANQTAGFVTVPSEEKNASKILSRPGDVYALRTSFFFFFSILMFSDQSDVQLTFHSFRHFTDKEYWFYIYCTARQELVSFTAVCFLHRLEQSHLIKGTGAERLAV